MAAAQVSASGLRETAKVTSTADSPAGFALPGCSREPEEAETWQDDIAITHKLLSRLVDGPSSCPDVNSANFLNAPRLVSKAPCVESSKAPMLERNGSKCSLQKQAAALVAAKTSVEAGETLILLDWDDTICPTTACHDFLVQKSPDSPGYKALRKNVASDTVHSDQEEQALRAHEAVAMEFIRLCAQLGHVVIVTMAHRSWIDLCLTSLLPGVAQVIEELNIELVCARQSIAKRFWRSAFSDDRDPSQFCKTKAMETVIKQFQKTRVAGEKYAAYSTKGAGETKRCSLKNVISIGDSHAERFALQDICFRWTKVNRKALGKGCNCKTVLLLAQPTVDQLTKQVVLMIAGLADLVKRKGDVDEDFSKEDLA